MKILIIVLEFVVLAVVTIVIQNAAMHYIRRWRVKLFTKENFVKTKKHFSVNARLFVRGLARKRNSSIRKVLISFTSLFFIGLSVTLIARSITQTIISTGEDFGIGKSMSLKLFAAFMMLTIILRLLEQVRFFTSILGLFSLLSFGLGVFIVVANMHSDWRFATFFEEADSLLGNVGNNSHALEKLQIPSLKGISTHLIEFDNTGLKFVVMGVMSGVITETALSVGRQDRAKTISGVRHKRLKKANSAGQASINKEIHDDSI